MGICELADFSFALLQGVTNKPSVLCKSDIKFIMFWELVVFLSPYSVSQMMKTDNNSQVFFILTTKTVDRSPNQ